MAWLRLRLDTTEDDIGRVRLINEDCPADSTVAQREVILSDKEVSIWINAPLVAVFSMRDMTATVSVDVP